jgi:hypothetical protein
MDNMCLCCAVLIEQVLEAYGKDLISNRVRYQGGFNHESAKSPCPLLPSGRERIIPPQTVYPTEDHTSDHPREV